MNQPLVSIVIPTYNRKKMVERLIRSVLKSTYKKIEVIIIDDASIDNTFNHISSKFKDIKVKTFKSKKNLFAAGTKNVGQNKAKGQLIMFIDDDNVVDRKMIEELVKVFTRNSEIGEAGPINYFFNKKDKVLLSRSSRNMFTTKTSHLRILSPFGSKEYWETDDIPNAFMVRSNIVKKNNIEFRTKFGIMYEESDYAYRIRKLGYKVIFVRKAKIYHDFKKFSTDRDYISHFLEDKRRPFLFARNRVIFHSLYSNSIQKLFIFIFWIWLFSGYYVYKLLLKKDFPVLTRVRASLNYFLGTLEGIRYLFVKYDLK